MVVRLTESRFRFSQSRYSYVIWRFSIQRRIRSSDVTKLYGILTSQFHRFLESAPDRGEWVSFRPQQPYFRGSSAGIRRTNRWNEARNLSNASEIRISSVYRENRNDSERVTKLYTVLCGSYNSVKGKGKGHPCTGSEALYRPYGP